MYLNDKSNRITLRLNDEQFSFVRQSADLYGVSPSEFLRIVISSCIATAKLGQEADTMKVITEEAEKIKKETDEGRENDKADKHNQL